MTPDDHAARARDLLRTADEILAHAIDENTGRPSENPMVHRQVQTLALLAQVHATLSLHQPALPPSSADAARPSNGAPHRGRIVPAPTRQPTPEPSALTRWERLSDEKVADVGQLDDGGTAAERDLLNTDGIDDDLPDLDDATDGPVEHKDYYPRPEFLPPDAYGDDDDDLPE